MNLRRLRAIVLTAVATLTVTAMPRAAAGQAPETVSFASSDGLRITADRYTPNPPAAPLIVAFHQAGWSRGEYRAIAPKLNMMGFNVLAVDLRSGGEVNGVVNETAREAEGAGKPSEYLDAAPDITAALRHARAQLAKGPVIAWGSSYSAALVLREVGRTPALADGVLAFAPAEYFGRAASVAREAARLKVPVFITSAREERGEWASIYAAIPAAAKRSYVPEAEGRHGSSALWESTAGSAGYWKAVTTFLDRNFPRSRARRNGAGRRSTERRNRCDGVVHAQQPRV